MKGVTHPKYTYEEVTHPKYKYEEVNVDMKGALGKCFNPPKMCEK